MFKKLHLNNINFKEVQKIESLCKTYKLTKNKNLIEILNDKIDTLKLDIELLFLTGYPHNFYNILLNEVKNIEIYIKNI